MHMTLFRLLLIILVSTFSTWGWAQKGVSVTGFIVGQDGKPIELATVSLNQDLVTHSKSNGSFTLQNVPAGTYTYRVSFVGYETGSGTVAVKAGMKPLRITLKELKLSLSNVVVTAKQVDLGSKSVIDQDAIRHIQPKSVTDMLQLLPGNLTENPDLNKLAQANIREIDGDDNNAMGTSVILDGTPLSNDANLQVVSPSRNGSQSSTSADGMNSQTTAGRGVDLRSVSAGNIESMEVIRGIPSVEYGNLTSGVVIVKTKAGRTPLEVKFSADPNSKLAFVGKGFQLKRGGAVNLSMDWSQSWADTRRHYLGFDRITAAGGYSNQFGPLSFNVKASFYTNVNNQKTDPQMVSSRTTYKNKNVGGRLSLNGSYRPTDAWLTSLDYNISGQVARTLDRHSTWVSNPDGVIIDSRNPGVYVARMQTVGYQSRYQIEGIPLNFYSQLVAGKYLRLNDRSRMTLKLGAEYTYDVNKGKGFTYDEYYPPQSQGTQTLRPRAFKDIPGMGTLSAFVSDRAVFSLGNIRTQAEAGVRMSTLFVDKTKSGGNSNFFVAEPRINLSLSLLGKRNNRFFDDLSVTGGYGISNKLPTLLYLYPDAAYFDNVSLSYYGNSTDSRMALVTTDVVRNTGNANLKPMNSTKWEAGLSFRKGAVKGFITYFNEHHHNEYGFRSHLIWQDYDKYSVAVGASNLTFNSDTRDVTYLLDGILQTASRQSATEMFLWSQPANTSRSLKHGIEYGLDLGEFKPLRTSLSINGAWFHILRTSQEKSYSYINSLSPYVGIMPTGAGTVQDRVNTTFRFITHIPALRMVFTTALQVVWYESTQSVWKDSDGNDRFYLKRYADDGKEYLWVNPEGYYDQQRNYHVWTQADADDPELKLIASRFQTYNFGKDVIDPWVMLNLRLTKELGKVGELSFIANNLTNTRRWHTNKWTKLKSQLYPDMYFGAELKLKF